MNKSILELLKKQGRWQAGRKDFTWEEKIRMVEAVREEFARLLPAFREGVVMRTDSQDASPKRRRKGRRYKRRETSHR